MKKENFFITKIKKYQIITFTLGFLFLYRFTITLISFFSDKETFIKTYNLSIWFFVIVIPIAYFIQWLIATWIASKFTTETLKEKFYFHPILTIIFSILYLVDLPYRLSGFDLGGGIFKMINIFEIIMYYIFISFLWWMLFCWISKKIWKKQKLEWSWYNKIIDKFFIFLLPTYKFILGLMVALLIFSIIFTIFL